MKILVACECSQKVCKAFRLKGHEAYSCDVQPCYGGKPEWHIQGDVSPLLLESWDMVIAFPPCTHLSAACANLWAQKQRDGRQQEAVDFFLKCVNANAPKICVENPVGYMNTHFKKPSQIINPYQFGEPYAKRTCLWLKNLEPLIPTKIMKQRYSWHEQVRNPQLRSETFQGIANAMAEQWG